MTINARKGYRDTKTYLIVDLEAAAMLDSHGGINQNPTGTLLNQKWSHARQRQKNAHY